MNNFIKCARCKTYENVHLWRALSDFYDSDFKTNKYKKFKFEILCEKCHELEDQKFKREEKLKRILDES